MSHHRGFRSLLAMAVLTTGLLGCTDLNGLFKLPGGTTTTDGGFKPDNGGLNPGGIDNPGDQLLSNGAATAITDVVATLRDVGALKHMASQQPLLSNSGSSLLSNAAGSLLSNGMSGYRVASMSHEDYSRLTWTDTGNWPNPVELTDDVTFSGVIKGSVDGSEVEHYTYTVTMGPGTYSREETVVKSAFRKTGRYEVTGTVLDLSPAGDNLFYYDIAGTSTYEPQGVNHKVDYALYTLIDESLAPWTVVTTVTGVLPTGTTVDLSTRYDKDYAYETGLDMRHTLSADGKMTVGGKEVKYKSAADVVDKAGVTGHMQLGLASDFWLRFDFASGQPLKGTRRNDKGEDLGPLELTEDKKKVIIKHPGEDKPEHLDLSVLPRLYLLGIESALPPF